ncbi:MAG: hypothetical protein M1814_004775 [Vezdaea aestivalis]|nr:MAG: hypothetical protein M1814_004775 [Vezdaea aestivalis]
MPRVVADSPEPSDSGESEILPRQKPNTIAPPVSTPSPVAVVQQSADASEDEEGEGDGEDEEYIIEKIVKHAMDSKKKQIIIYEVKWKGWKETSWEPRESFGEDNDKLETYWEKIGGEPYYNPGTDSVMTPKDAKAKKPRNGSRKLPIRTTPAESTDSEPASAAVDDEEEEAAKPKKRAGRLKKNGTGKTVSKRKLDGPSSAGLKKKLRRPAAEGSVGDGPTEVAFNGHNSDDEEDAKVNELIPKGDWDQQIGQITTITNGQEGLEVQVVWNNGKHAKYTSDVINRRAPQKVRDSPDSVKDI